MTAAGLPAAEIAPMLRRLKVLPVALLLALILSGCAGSPADDTSSTSGDPTLTLISPSDGDTVCGSPLEVLADVQNFTLTNETIEDPPPNTGHMHVYLNGQEVAQSDQETVEITDVADGEWQLGLDLALADHSALEPYVGVTIYITVDNSLCSE